MTQQSTISVSAIGLDAPGLVSKITRKIFELGGNIVDVEESCRRGLFSIFLIVTFPHPPASMSSNLERLRAIEQETGLKVVVGAYHEHEAVCTTEKETHLVTVLGMDRPGIIARISEFFLLNRINIENCRMIARGKFFSMEMVIDVSHMISNGEQGIDTWKTELKDLCASLNQSVVIQSENIFSKVKKLVVFDLESTLLDESSLQGFMQEIEGQGLTKDQPGGDDRRSELIEFPAETAKALRGMPVRDLERFSHVLRMTPGSFELVRVLKSMGFKIALISSGFDCLVKNVFQEAGVDYAFSNTLQVNSDGIITGELGEPIITGDTKEQILEFIMNVEKISRDQVIAIGDGSARSHFIRNAGLSIAFKPGKESTQTDGFLSSDQVMNLLYCLGIPERELCRYVGEQAGS